MRYIKGMLLGLSVFNALGNPSPMALNHALQATTHISVIKKPTLTLDHNGKPHPHRHQTEGSGVILDAAHGIIVTNAHVTHDHKSITVTLANGERYMGKLLGEDEPTDLAFLKKVIFKAKAPKYLSVPGHCHWHAIWPGTNRYLGIQCPHEHWHGGIEN